MRVSSYAKRTVGVQLILKRFRNQEMKEPLKMLRFKQRKKFQLNQLPIHYLLGVPLELE